MRGLHPYYEELALRFAERGIDALAIDWFGRTAGPEPRGDDFDHMPEVAQTTWAGISADIVAAVEEIASPDEDRPRPAPSSRSASAWAAGCRSWPRPWACLGRRDGHVRDAQRRMAQRRPGAARPRVASSGRRSSGCSAAPTRPSSADAVAAFDAALSAAGVDHRLVTYPGAPHSFFDRKAAEYADASAAAWSEVLAFIAARTALTRAPTLRRRRP